MLQKLKQLLNTLSDSEKKSIHLSSDERQLATAALLVEVATIDQHFDQTESDVLMGLLRQQFSLSNEELEELVTHARTESQESASLYQFTKLINRHCNDDEKYNLACGLWEIAYADGNLDKYEEHIVRRIADLIHLRHSDFIRSKHCIRDKQISI